MPHLSVTYQLFLNTFLLIECLHLLSFFNILILIYSSILSKFVIVTIL
jgi:hypothetical protein